MQFDIHTTYAFYKFCTTMKITASINKITHRNSPLPTDIVFRFHMISQHASNGNFNLPKCHNVYGERLIEFIGTKIWNMVPIEITTAPHFSLECKPFFPSISGMFTCVYVGRNCLSWCLLFNKYLCTKRANIYGYCEYVRVCVRMFFFILLADLYIVCCILY